MGGFVLFILARYLVLLLDPRLRAQLSKTILGNLAYKQAVTTTKLISFRMDIKSKVTAMHSLTTFSLIKRQLDQSPIRKVIKTHNADKHSKGFDTYRHLLAMLFAQLTDCKSLRELEITLNSHHSKHYHLGMSTVQRGNVLKLLS